MDKPRAAFFTLGCKVNQYETHAMTDQFARSGFEIVPPEDIAEVYVVNSCTVTATGDKKSRQALRRFRRQAPDAVLVLCGCFPQAFPGQAALISEADVVMGNKNRAGVLPAVIEKLASSGGKRLVDVAAHSPGEAFEPLRVGSVPSRTRAFVKIQDGCERRCSYCIIPDARGPVRSKPISELSGELSELADAGYREVVLVGINLCCYGQDIGLTLTDALRLACDTPGIRRVRLGSLEPETLTRADAKVWAGFDKLCPQFHLSLQSGCDATLARMNRHYDTVYYRELVLALREAFPAAAFTTDIMVGFPGETRQEYLQSRRFVEETGFSRIHVFVYSPRPGTPAALMPQTDPGDASSRAKDMARVAADSRCEFLKAQLGKNAEVLVEERGRDGRWRGYTPCYTQVYLDSAGDLAGRIVLAALTGVSGDGCTGRVVKTIL